MTLALVAEGVAVHAPSGPIVRRVDLAVAPGEAVCLVGETGAGKSLVAEALLVEDGPAERVLAAPKHPWTRRLVAAQPANWPRRPAPPAGEVLIAARGLGFGWARHSHLFSGIDLSLRAGEILGLTGPSGAGKSTLCDLLLGLRRPSSGQVLWRGQDIAATPALRRTVQRSVQKLFQDPGASFPPHRRLRAVFADLAAVTEAPLDRLPPLLERLGLRADVLGRRVGEISGGEAQRLALARALLLRPTALVADEPTSRLDAVTQAELCRLLRELADRDGLAVLLVSHDDALLAAMASRTLRLAPPE